MTIELENTYTSSNSASFREKSVVVSMLETSTFVDTRDGLEEERGTGAFVTTRALRLADEFSSVRDDECGICEVGSNATRFDTCFSRGSLYSSRSC